LPFIGLGLGYIVLEAFCEAQDHANPLTTAIFYEELRKAAEATESEPRQSALKQAAQLLLQAREVVYPSQIYQALTFILDGTSSADRLRLWLQGGLPLTLVGSSDILQGWANTDQSLVNVLRERVQAGMLDWWGGCYFDQEDAALPRAAWLKNLSKGLKQAQQILNKPLDSTGRRRFAATPTLPALLHHFGLKRSLGLSFDGGSWPHSSSSLTAWRGPDSKLIETCNRKPEPIHEPQTWFHLGNLLYETQLNESVAWLHLGAATLPAEIPLLLKAWAKLHELAPVFGQLGTLENAICEIPATEQFTPPSADDFQSDYLVDLTGQGHLPKGRPDPISRFAQAAVDWRTWEAAKTLLALWAAITSPNQIISRLAAQLDDWADKLLERWPSDHREETPANPEPLIEIKDRLAQRLLSHASSQSPGYLIFNPCSFERRIPFYLEEATTLLPAPAYASERCGAGTNAVVEVPPLGFAWLPRSVEKGTKVRIPKNPIVEGNTLRNEYLQVDVDPQTGGLKAIRDAQKQIPRLGQQLVFGPGSTMRCQSILPRLGHVVGAIVTAGVLVDAHEQIIANFEQTLALWAGRKLLEVEILLLCCAMGLARSEHAVV
jgi:alpha-mannosidase